jgi:hypothetical protein
MVRKQFIFIASIMIILVGLLFIRPNITGEATLQEKIRLGYCPTMLPEARELAEKEDYILIEFNSASEVLQALKENKIQKAMIGRKAKNSELPRNIKEIVIESGYTLASNSKTLLFLYQLESREVYTSLEKEIAEELLPNSKIIYLKTIEEAKEKIKEGKIILISWEEWEDKFELVVILKGTEKVKNFRGVFLYE